MGANSSSLSELPKNEHLIKLSSTDEISPNDPFWNQLLSFTFQIPRNSADQRLLEESTVSICKNFSINNCRTGNFASLIQVFLLRATELKASAQTEDNIFSWQTFNALFIIRNLSKYFVENLSEEIVVQQFETNTPAPDGSQKQSAESVLEEFMKCLIEVIVDVPILSFTYALHLECLNTLIILLSMQMFQPTPANHSKIYKHLMQGKCSIHACVFMKTLVLNYVKQEKCPPELLQSGDAHGGLYNFGAAVATGLWSVMTLGMAGKGGKPLEESASTLIANQSLLLVLVLTNHCTNDVGLHNPYRQALFSFTNSQDQAANTSPTQAVATFKIDLTSLFDTLTKTLKDDQSTLLLYLFLHRNKAVKSFFLSRTNIDQLVMPLLKILYHAQEKNSHHIYMALIVLLILSEDDYFNKAVHETTIKNVAWFKERAINEISLGGMLILVVIRTIQFNMTRMRDKYLHTNCLAALANMSSQFRGLHPYVTQRLVSLFGLLCKKHTRLVEQIKNSAMENGTQESGEEADPEVDHVQDLAVLEEVIRMVLEIINSCLTHSIHHNPNLVYTLLYNKDSFNTFRTHPTFQDIIQNVDMILSYFATKLEQENQSLTVAEVVAIVRQGVSQFRRDRLKKFPELKFRYVEEESPEEFFIPYIWSLIFHSSNLYFNPSRIQIFSLQASS